MAPVPRARLRPVADPTPDERAAFEQRMIRFAEPSRHQAALLVYGLYGAPRLSRRLPGAIYFRLIRTLWGGIDAGFRG